MPRSHYTGIKSSNFLGHPYLLVTQLSTMMQKHFLKSSHSACARGIIFLYVTIRSFCFVNWSLRLFVTSIIMDNSLGTLSHCGVCFNAHMPNPYLHPTNNFGQVYLHFFPSFNIVKGGRRENCNKISKACTVLWGQSEIKENYEYCMTVPTTFLSRVVWILGLMTTMFSPFFSTPFEYFEYD